MQEVGRAGRDGRISHCHLFLNPSVRAGAGGAVGGGGCAVGGGGGGGGSGGCGGGGGGSGGGGDICSNSPNQLYACIRSCICMNV